MRKLPWKTPFAEFGPLHLDVEQVLLHTEGSLTVSTLAPQRRRWRVLFGTVYGYKVSSESYFAWAAWHARFPEDEGAATYILEGSSWRSDFWNDGAREFPMTHFGINTSSWQVEVLADWAEFEELV